MGQPWCKQPQAHHPRQLQRSATSQAKMSTFIEATTVAQSVMPRLPLDGGSRVNIDLHNYTKERPTEASQSSPTTTHKFLVTHRGHQGSSSRHSHDYLWKGDQEYTSTSTTTPKGNLQKPPSPQLRRQSSFLQIEPRVQVRELRPLPPTQGLEVVVGGHNTTLDKLEGQGHHSTSSTTQEPISSRVLESFGKSFRPHRQSPAAIKVPNHRTITHCRHVPNETRIHHTSGAPNPPRENNLPRDEDSMLTRTLNYDAPASGDPNNGL